MSIESDFYFNLPQGRSSGDVFAEHLRNDLGLKLSEKNEHGVWLGNCLGMELSFDPKHDLENDGELKLEMYSSSIGITGYTSAGQIRIIQLQQIIHIAIAICFLNEIDGLVVHEQSERIIHLGYNKAKQCLWDYGSKREITEYEKLQKCFFHGVKN